MKVFPLSVLVFAFVVAALPGATSRGDAAAPLPGETVPLPDFTVTGKKELPPPESWQYTRLEDGTEVLSNASERASRKLLRDFQMFQQALALAWPELGNQPVLVPRTLILCGRHDKFDDFASRDSGRSDLASTSRFVRNREQTSIIVDLQATSLNLSGLDDDSTGNTTSFEVDPYKQLYREYVRYLLSNSSTRTPPWLQEGIAQIVMAMEFTPDWVKLGEIDSSVGGTAVGTDVAASTDATDDSSGEEAPAETSVGDRPFTAVLHHRALMPMDKFFGVTADAPEATNPLGNNRWAKQAYAFVHLCLYGNNGRYKAAFDEFTKRLATQPVSEALFKECFKMSYRDMLFELRAHVDGGLHRTDIFKLKSDSPRFGGAPVVMREATQSEIGRIKGDAQRLAGRLNDALTSYNDAYVRGEREPILLAAYGIAASESGQTDRALPLLEAAAKAPGTRRPTAYVELGRQRLIAAKAKAGANGRIDDAQLAAVMEPLLKARSIRLPLPGIYEVIAEAWLAAATPPKLENFALIGEGVRMFPRDLALLYPLAQLYKQSGEPAAAAKVCQIGMHFADAPDDRGRFEQLLATLPPAPATPAK
jgi:hypothetical protein